MHAGRPQHAAWHWWRRIRRAGRDAEAWAGLIVCAHTAGRGRLAQRAQARCRQRLDPDARHHALAQAWHHLAPTRVARNGPSSAPSPLTELLQRSTRVLADAAEAHPGRADVHYHHARCLAGLGARGRASVAVDQALAINPKYRDAINLKADLAT